MLTADDGDYRATAVDDYREHVQDVAAQHAHIKRLVIYARRIVPAENNLPPIVACESDLRIHVHRIHQTADAANCYWPSGSRPESLGV
jgi:hypothetical protein